MNFTPETLVTVRTDYIESIISKEEVEILIDKNQINNLNNLALISINDPQTQFTNEDRLPLVEKYCNEFSDFIQVEFWDITSPSEDGTQLPIDENTISKLVNFIKTNHDKKFIIHCNAGISRSAGVGLLVHAVLGDFNDLYEFKTGFNNVIDEHYRYAPNLTIVDGYFS